MIQIRPEKQADDKPVRKIDEQAFGRAEEGLIVDSLRDTCVRFMFVAYFELIGVLR